MLPTETWFFDHGKNPGKKLISPILKNSCAFWSKNLTLKILDSRKIVFFLLLLNHIILLWTVVSNFIAVTVALMMLSASWIVIFLGATWFPGSWGFYLFYYSGQSNCILLTCLFQSSLLFRPHLTTSWIWHISLIFEFGILSLNDFPTVAYVRTGRTQVLLIRTFPSILLFHHTISRRQFKTYSALFACFLTPSILVAR